LKGCRWRNKNTRKAKVSETPVKIKKLYYLETHGLHEDELDDFGLCMDDMCDVEMWAVVDSSFCV